MVNFETFKKNVFKILTAEATGSGFMLKDLDVIITNYHVIEGLREVAVETFDNKRVKARVVQVNPKKDIAFLKVDQPIGDVGLTHDVSALVQDRESVVALGYPLGMNCTYTQGIVSNANYRVQDLAYIQIDAAINPGNSGGPLLNLFGHVVGINSRKIQDAENIGFSIPVKFVFEDLQKWTSLPTTEFSVLCISCENQLTVPNEHCPHCGFQVDSEKYFRITPIEKLASQVESLISFSGFDPVTLRSGKNYWELVETSDVVRMFFYTSEYFFAASPIALLPKTNLERVLIFLNSEHQFSHHLGIDKSKIFYSFRKHASDLMLDEHLETVKVEFKKYLEDLKILEQILIKDFECQPFESLIAKVSS